MKYKLLPNAIRKKLEGNFFAAIRYESLAGRSHLVDDVILVHRNTAMNVDFLDGYSVSHPRVWFEFVTKDKSKEEAERMAESAVSSIDAKQYKDEDDGKSECPKCGKELKDVEGHIERVHEGE